LEKTSQGYTKFAITSQGLNKNIKHSGINQFLKNIKISLIKNKEYSSILKNDLEIRGCQIFTIKISALKILFYFMKRTQELSADILAHVNEQ